MKPQLERISTSGNERSFQYFKVETDRFPPYWHYHPQIELTYIERGSGIRFVGDSIAPFSSGDLVLIGQNLPHHWVSGEVSKESAHCIAHVLQFQANLLFPFPEFWKVIEMLKSAQFGLHFESEKISKGVVLMSSQSASERVIQLFRLLNKMTELESTRLSSISYLTNSPIKRHQSRISEATTSILNHLDEKISLESMAEQQNMTPTSFSRWFKKSLGKGFLEYLQALRIEKSCQLLLSTDFPITQIAYQVGFESMSSFNRSFKKLKATSPREYRKSNLERRHS